MGNCWRGKNALMFRNRLLSACTLTFSRRWTDAGKILLLDQTTDSLWIMWLWRWWSVYRG